MPGGICWRGYNIVGKASTNAGWTNWNDRYQPASEPRQSCLKGGSQNGSNFFGWTNFRKAWLAKWRKSARLKRLGFICYLVSRFYSPNFWWIWRKIVTFNLPKSFTSFFNLKRSWIRKMPVSKYRKELETKFASNTLPAFYTWPQVLDTWGADFAQWILILLPWLIGLIIGVIPKKRSSFCVIPPEEELAKHNCKKPAFLPNSSSLFSKSGLAQVEIAFDSLHMIGYFGSNRPEFQNQCRPQVSGQLIFGFHPKAYVKVNGLFFICRLAKTFFSVRNKFNSLFSKRIRIVNTPPLPISLICYSCRNSQVCNNDFATQLQHSGSLMFVPNIFPRL